MKKIIFNFIFSVIGVCYPFLLFFFKEEYFFEILLCMSLLWLLKGILSQADRSLNFAFALIFAVLAKFDITLLVYLYPSVISLLFLWIFASSLSGESFITKIAKKAEQLKGKELDEAGIIYTRNLTKIWCIFFVFNSVISAILAIFSDKFLWTLYAGAISYFLMGILFVCEFIYRKVVIEKNHK